jgi:hypothetical protein
MEMVVACVALLLQYLPLRFPIYKPPATEQMLAAY